MLAIVKEVTVGPAGVDAAEATVHQDEVPRFLDRAGAVAGLWMADRATGRLLTVTIWTDRPGDDVGRVADVLGLRMVDLGGTGDRLWARVTRVEGVDAGVGEDPAALHVEVGDDESRSEGFCGSCWLGLDDDGQGLAVSIWDGPHALIRGERDSKRRRRELERRLGARVTSVTELECLAVAVPRRS